MHHRIHILHFVFLAIPFSTTAQDGTLDPTFATGGVFTHDFGEFTAVSYDMVVQPDGKFLLGGFTSGNTSNVFALIRCLPDGTLDPSFSFDGQVITTINERQEEGHTLALFPDGRIAFAGFTDTSNVLGESFYTGAVVMYGPDGSLDPGFASGGIKEISVDGGRYLLRDMLATADGGLILAGNGPQGVTLMKLTGSGALDPSFSFDGIVATSILGVPAGVSAMAVQDDGKIVVMGNVGMISSDSAYVVRYHPNGSLDLSFGDAGITMIGTGYEYTRMNHLLLLDDGRLFINGSGQQDGIRKLLVWVLDPSGTPDASVGPNGIHVVDLGEASVSSTAAVQLPNGKLVLSGTIRTGGTDYGMVLRLDLDLELDLTFGTAGWGGFTIDEIVSQSGYYELNSVALLPDGQILTSGFAGYDGENFMLAARFNNDIGLGVSVPPIQLQMATVSPNPAQSTARVSLEVQEGGRYAVDLVDEFGALVQRIAPERMLARGTHHFTLDLGELPAASYFIRTTNSGRSSTVPLIKQ